MVSLSDRPQDSPLTAVLRRVLEGALIAWASVTLTFFALRLAAGDPVASLFAQGLLTQQQAEGLRHELGFDRPLGVQYLDFLFHFMQGDLGDSLYTRRPVSKMIAEQLPASLELGAAGLGWAMLFGLGMGVAAGWNSRSTVSRLASGVAGLATALPVTVIGVSALIVFGIGLHVTSGHPLIVASRRLLLPSLVLGFASSGAIARVVEAGLRETLSAPFMLAARARGLRPRTRLVWHALRPALPPAVSLIALSAAFLFTGTVVTETVFSRPGLGRLLVNSILQGDFPIAQGVVGLAAVFYTMSNLLADVVAFLLDPRLRRRA